MDIFHIITVLLTFSAVFSYLNYLYLHLPRTIGLMFAALMLSLGMMGLSHLGWGVEAQALNIVGRIDFNRFLLHGILSFLLFAGALDVEANELMVQKWEVVTLATVGVVLSTFLIGAGTWAILSLLNLEIPFIFCLLFGALISPTDPVAVLNILKTIHAPKNLETQMAGEALFNDGVGVVVFVVILRTAVGGHGSFGEAALLFAQEAFGGVLFGLGVGYIAYQMLKRVDNYQVEVLITLGLVTGGYALADALHTSGPLAIVAAGILIGNQGRAFAMSETTRRNLDTFWELIDEVLNAILFILIGLEVFALELTTQHILAGLALIPVVLLARMTSVGVPFSFLRRRKPSPPNVVKILTWGGLRGGIAVALALSIPPGPERGILLVGTYIVVIFSILVQGLTTEKLVRKWTA